MFKKLLFGATAGALMLSSFAGAAFASNSGDGSDY